MVNYTTLTLTDMDVWLLRQDISTEESQRIIGLTGTTTMWRAIVNCFSLARIVDFMRSMPLVDVLCYVLQEPSYARPIDIFVDEVIRHMDDTHIPVLNRLCFEFTIEVYSMTNKIHNIEFIFNGIRQHDTMPRFFSSLDEVRDLLKERLGCFIDHHKHFKRSVPALIHYISPYILESELFWQMVTAYVPCSKYPPSRLENDDLSRLLLANCRTTKDKEEQEAAI